MNRSATASALLLYLLLAACGGGGGGGSSQATPPPTNRAPSANAGADASISISAADVALDGSASSDPENGALTFAWTVVSEPAGSSIALSDTAIASPTFASMVPGSYEFELTVSDPGGLSSSDTVVVTLVNDAPVVSLGAYSRTPDVGGTIQLDASASSDPNGHAITFEWELVSAPAGSSLATDYAGPTHDVTFDVQGNYVFELRVADGYDSTTATLDSVRISAYETFVLTAMIDDAEFDDAGQRVVAVAGSELIIIGTDGTESTVALPTAAVAVSVSPDGLHAAVAHDGWVSHVDLDAETVLATHAVSAQLGDVVLDGDGFAHGFPQTGQWVAVHTVDLATGVETTWNGSVRERTIARLHPDGDRMYGATNGISPGDLERYWLSNGQVTGKSDSIYHGHHALGGDLWFGPRGDTVMARSGNVLTATSNTNNDMRFLMRLDGVSAAIHASSSDYTNQWLLAANADNIKLYDADDGSLDDTLTLPERDPASGATWAARYVFGSDMSSSHYVLAADDPTTPTSWALIAWEDPAASAANLPPIATAARYGTVRVDDPVTLDGSASSDPEGQALAYTWSLVTQPAGSSLVLGNTASPTAAFTPAVAGAYEFELTVNDGERTSAPARVSVSVFDVSASLVHRLASVVTDVEYSRSLNTLVYLSDSDQALRLLDLSDFSERIIPMPEASYTVGVSPDGQFAAVSHDELVSLVDLVAGTVTDSQDYTADWGDVVLDHNNRAHVIPAYSGWVGMYSLDFAADMTESITFGIRAGTQLRMHPVENWIYGADRGLSPSDFEKFDVSSFPPTSVGDSPYHGTYPISGNIWISEDGDRLLVRGGASFHSSSDPAVDMTYAGSLENSAWAEWADHSAITNEWAVLTSCTSGCAPGTLQLALFTDDFLDEVERRDLEEIPTATQSYPTNGTHVFQSADGTAIITVLKGEGLTDAFAIGVSAR